VEDRLLEKALAHLFFPRGQVWRGSARSASLPARADKVIRNPGISQEPGPRGHVPSYRNPRMPGSVEPFGDAGVAASSTVCRALNQPNVGRPRSFGGGGSGAVGDTIVVTGQRPQSERRLTRCEIGVATR